MRQFGLRAHRFLCGVLLLCLPALSISGSLANDYRTALAAVQKRLREVRTLDVVGPGDCYDRTGARKGDFPVKTPS